MIQKFSWRQKGLPGYCFKSLTGYCFQNIDRPFCLQTESSFHHHYIIPFNNNELCYYLAKKWEL